MICDDTKHNEKIPYIALEGIHAWILGRIIKDTIIIKTKGSIEDK